MASYPDTLIDLTSEALSLRFRSTAPFGYFLPSAFNRMINPNRAGLDVRGLVFYPEGSIGSLFGRTSESDTNYRLLEVKGKSNGLS
jgi:hypothetical protein